MLPVKAADVLQAKEFRLVQVGAPPPSRMHYSIRGVSCVYG